MQRLYIGKTKDAQNGECEAFFDGLTVFGFYSIIIHTDAAEKAANRKEDPI